MVRTMLLCAFFYTGLCMAKLISVSLLFQNLILWTFLNIRIYAFWVFLVLGIMPERFLEAESCM